MSGEPSPDWVLDSLVDYLRGPIWNLPILTFIEHKSVVFEPGLTDNEVYRKTHSEFRNLVDLMLGTYMDDLGVQPEQLEEALAQIQPHVRAAALQELLEPVWAAGDYGLFQRLMIAKNAQLHNQALRLLRKQQEAADDPDKPFDDYEEAIQRSMAEQEVYKREESSEQDTLEKALAASLLRGVDSAFLSESQASSAEPGPEEIEQRRALLRAQRDKLVNLKRNEREKQLTKLEDLGIASNSLNLRPKSGRAAREAIAGQSQIQVDDRTLEFRRLLMKRLRDEVDAP